MLSFRVSAALREKLRGAALSVSLGSQLVGRGHPTYFVAEIGNNHNGDFYLAKRTIEQAARSGAQAVKFQKRSVKDTFARELRDKPQTKDEIRGATYGEYREGLEFSLEDFVRLKKVAEVNNVAFFATPFDTPSVAFLEKVGVPFYKVSSFDVSHPALLDAVARLKKPILLSTGMSTLQEVEDAVRVVLKHHCQLVILHCVSVYPTPDASLNLNLMRLLDQLFHPLPIGYSGHESDTLASLAAVALGAALVERHFTLSRLLPGADHSTVSIEPAMFADMVRSARRIETILGTGEKAILEAEIVTRAKHGKSVVAARAIAKGAVIAAADLTGKSPGYGISPRYLDAIIGRRAAADIAADAVLQPEDIEWAPADGAAPVRPLVAERQRSVQ